MAFKMLIQTDRDYKKLIESINKVLNNWMIELKGGDVDDR